MEGRVGNTVPYTYATSCGGTVTQWSGELRWNPDLWPEHAALHATIVDLQRQVNAMKDLIEKQGGWWLRRRLTRYLRTR